MLRHIQRGAEISSEEKLIKGRGTQEMHKESELHTWETFG